MRVADDIAASLYHLCEDLDRVHVRIVVPPSKAVEANCPQGSAEGTVEARPVARAEISVPIGPMGNYGAIVVTARAGARLEHEHLLALICANQAEAACRTLDLERDVAQAHERLAALGKLGALGQLVGGVAHEVRTPLTYAFNNLYALEKALTSRHGDEVAATAMPHLREMENAFDRIHAIVLQLRKFAKQEVASRREEDMRDLVREALRLWRATHAGSVDVREYLRPTPPVVVDRGQLQQVVLNLVQNASEATGPNGVVTISSGDTGTHGTLTIEDDGPGMSPEVLARLFQPLHTTKPDGLGLGLSIVRGIIEAHRGSIHVDSALGMGTRVTVRIPRAPPA